MNSKSVLRALADGDFRKDVLCVALSLKGEGRGERIRKIVLKAGLFLK